MRPIVLVLFLASCNRAQAPQPVAEASGKQRFGQALAPAQPITVAALLAKPDPAAPVTVEGRVRKACTRRGCWLELAEGTRDGTPGCRVTFKDYGFFVPTNSAGAHARVQGAVQVDVLPAASVRHYEEEGAVFASKLPDGSAREVRLVATGVELWR